MRNSTVGNEGTPDLDLEALTRIDREHVVHSWTVQDDYESKVIVGGQGHEFWDAGGRRYLDFTSQAWYANIGLGSEVVARAVAEQVAGAANIYGYGTLPKLRLTEKLLALLPSRYQRVFFGCNGSDAIESALKIARMITGRQTVIAFWGEYHGAAMGATSVTGLPGWMVDTGAPVPGTVFVPSPYHYRSPFGGPSQDDTDRLTLEFLRRTIEREGPETIAAVLGEPLPTSGIACVPGPDYWRGVRALCDQYGLLLISDEIVSGFGRTGHWFARDHYDYEPDIICLAKGLTSGYLPLSAAVFRDDVAERFQSMTFRHGLTYAGHPVCCAAALANIEVLERRGLVGNAAAQGGRLTHELAVLAERHPSVGCATNLGLFAVIELVQDAERKLPFPDDLGLDGKPGTAAGMGGRVVAALLDRGIVVRGAPECVAFAPPLGVTDDEIDRVMGALSEVLTQVDRLVS